MRMDDYVPAVSTPDDDLQPAAGLQRSGTGGLRFTSNVVGSLFLVTDVICFIIAAPITLLA